MGRNQSEKAWSHQRFGKSNVPQGDGAGLRHIKNHNICPRCGNTNPQDAERCQWPGCDMTLSRSHTVREK